MEGFQLPTSAILILSQGSGWHGNLILGKEGREGGGDGGEGVIFKKKSFLNTLCVVFLTQISSSFPANASDLNFDFHCSFFFLVFEFVVAPVHAKLRSKHCVCVSDYFYVSECMCVQLFACVSRNYANGLWPLGRWSSVAMALAGGEIRSGYKALMRET